MNASQITRWITVLLLAIVGCTHQPNVQLPRATKPTHAAEQKKDVVVQLFERGVKPVLKIDGGESAISGFDKAMGEYFKAKTAEEVFEAGYFLQIDRAVPFGDYQQLQYWMSRSRINKHFLMVDSDDGPAAFEINNPPLDTLADRMLCEHFGEPFFVSLTMRDWGLPPSLPDLDIPAPPFINPFKALFDTALGQPIHLQIDAEGKCSREGRLLSSDELNTLLAAHPGGPQVEPYFLVEMADAMPLEHYIPILEMLHTHHNDYLVLSSSHFAILKQIYLPRQGPNTPSPKKEAPRSGGFFNAIMN